MIVVVKAYEASRKNNLNVILISVDTLRADHMGVYGYAKDTTPNLDKLAKSSTVYTNLRTVVPMTWPSFIALFTGLEPFSTRIAANGLTFISSTTNSLPKILAKKGYRTAAFVSNVANIKNDFEDFSFIPSKEFYLDNGVERYNLLDENGSDSVITEAKNWLDNNYQNKFFLWVHLMDPHAPYSPSDKYKCITDKKYCDVLFKKSFGELDLDRASFQFCQNSPVPKEIVGEMQTLYDGGIREADYYVGEMLAKIKKLGLDKNTLVIFYSDHGEGFEHNYYFNHRGVLYDSAVRIPLIIKNPMFPFGSRSEALMQNTDILPTILDLLGISQSDLNINGTSNGYMRKYVYSVNNDWTKYSVFDGRYKYIYSLPNSCLANNQKEELFDLKSDKNELNNLANKEKHVRQQLKEQLFLYLSEYNLPSKTQYSSTAVATSGAKLKEGERFDLKSLSY